MTATLGAVDKVAISSAAIYGLQDDLHLVGQQYSWAGSILFLGVCNVSIDNFIVSNLVTGDRWHVAIHVLASQTAICQIPVGVFIWLVSHGTSLANFAQLERVDGFEILHG